jgi:hypothetical protein
MNGRIFDGTSSLAGSIWDSKEETLGAINSLLDEKRLVDSGQWALSLVKSKSKEHAFLLLEGKIKNEFIIFRTDLFLRKDTDKTLFGQKIKKGSVIDGLFECSASSNGRAFVKVIQLSIKDYDEIILNSAYQGWVIDTNQAEKLLKRLQAEGLKEYNYHSGGNSSGFSVSDSRSTRTSCITWCEAILKEELNIRLGKEWLPVMIPSSRVQLAQKFSEKARQPQLTSARQPTVAFPIDPRAQRHESRARMSTQDQATYFQPVDARQPPRSIVDPSHIVIPDYYLVTIACGKIEQTKNHIFLILESIEQQYYTFRRIDLINSSAMDMIHAHSAGAGVVEGGSQKHNTKSLAEIQSMIDEYTMESASITAEHGAKLQAKIEEENQRRLNPTPITNGTGPGLFSKSRSTPRQDFIASLKVYLSSIGADILPKNKTLGL